MKTIWKKHLGFSIIVILFVGCGLLRLNDLSLYTDCTRYLIWGNSVAHGKGFVDNTQPVPEYYVVNAPLFSVILAPVLLFFPLSLSAAKVWTLAWGVLALLLFYRWMCKQWGEHAALAATLFLAFNPLTLVLSTEVLSETSFLAVIFGAFLLIERWDQREHSRWTFSLFVLLLSCVTLIREVGAALVLASLFFLLLKRKWIPAAIVGSSALLLFALWSYRNLSLVGTPETAQSPNLIYIFKHFVTPTGTTLLHELGQRVLMNFQAYAPGLGGMLLYFVPSVLIVTPSALGEGLLSVLNFVKGFAPFIFLPVCALGIMHDLKTSATALFRISFLGLYLAVILLYPVQDVRFLFPLLPCALFYTFAALRNVSDRIHLNPLRTSLIMSILTGVALFPNLVCLFEIIRTNQSYQSDPERFSAEQAVLTERASYFSTPWKLLGTWIDRSLPAGSIVVTPNKEIVPFAPREKFLELNRAVPLPFFESFLRDHGADYLLAPQVLDSLTEYQPNIDESQRFWFVPEARAHGVTLYRIVSRFEDPDMRSTHLPNAETIPPFSRLFQWGRRALRNEQYVEAESLFSQLRAQYPRHASILYQLLLTNTFSLDSAKVIRTLHELYSAPNSTSYIAPARAHIDAMLMLLRVRATGNTAQQAKQLHEVSRLYWKFGYPRQAYRLNQHALEIDTSFFVGYLWAYHDGVQIGDTVRARLVLRKLAQVYGKNPVVQGFQLVAGYHEQLRHTGNGRDRSNLFLALSRAYNAINLPEEAFDDAQRAVGAYPKSVEAWQYLASLFEKKNCHLTAQRALQHAAENTSPSALNPDRTTLQK